MERLFGINPDKRKDENGLIQIPVGLEREGVAFPAGIKDNFFNQLLFSNANGLDQVIGSASQLANNDCTCAWNDSAQQWRDKDGNQVIFQDWDRIGVVGSDTPTTNYNLGTAKHLQIRSINGGQLLFGGGGAVAPTKLIHNPTLSVGEYDYSNIDILTNIEFENLGIGLTNDEKRYYAYQGIGAKISLNREICYHGKDGGSKPIAFDSDPDNPYWVRADGHAENWLLSVGNNDDLAFFRMLNKRMNGWRDGAEVQSRFTNPGLTARLFGVNKIHRFISDLSTLDLERHSRSSETTAISATANFTAGSRVAVFPSGIGNIKNGMRIQGGSIPGGSGNTTYLTNIIGNTAEMFDFDTGNPVTVGTATGVSVSIDNSGAVNGSHNDFAMQGHRFNQYFDAFTVATGAATRYGAGSPSVTPTSLMVSSLWNRDIISDGTNGTPQVGRQTQPESTAVKFYYPA